jgi:hypothetical protein
MIGFADGGHLTWYPSQEVSSLNLDHTLIPLRIISTYKSSYGGAHVAQTSGPPEWSGGTLAGMQ